MLSSPIIKEVSLKDLISREFLALFAQKLFFTTPYIIFQVKGKVRQVSWLIAFVEFSWKHFLIPSLFFRQDEVNQELAEVNKVNNDANRIFSKLMLRDENDDGESSSEEESEGEDEERFASAAEFKSYVKSIFSSLTLFLTLS